MDIRGERITENQMMDKQSYDNLASLPFSAINEFQKLFFGDTNTFHFTTPVYTVNDYTITINKLQMFSLGGYINIEYNTEINILQGTEDIYTRKWGTGLSASTYPRYDIVVIKNKIDTDIYDEETKWIQNPDGTYTTSDLNTKTNYSFFDIDVIHGTPAHTPTEPSVPAGYVKLFTIAVPTEATILADCTITLENYTVLDKYLDFTYNFDTLKNRVDISINNNGYLTKFNSKTIIVNDTTELYNALIDDNIEIIYCNPGTYTITGITLSSSKKIIGLGEIGGLYDHTPTKGVIFDINNSNPVIDTLNGTYNHIIFENINFVNNFGLTLNNFWQTIVKNCYFSSNIQTYDYMLNIAPADGSGDNRNSVIVKFEDNLFLNTNINIQVNYENYIYFFHNNFNGNMADNININIEGVYQKNAKNIIINDNTIEAYTSSTGTTIININYADEVLITNNIIYKGTGAGISVTNFSNLVNSNNIEI